MEEIIGKWSIHYSWNGKTFPDDTVNTYKADGSLIIDYPGGQAFGKWEFLDEYFIARLDYAGHAVFVARLTDNKLSGVMSKFDGDNGTWSATRIA